MAESERPIVVGVDGSRSALRAVAWAAGEAAVRGAPLWLVLACPLPEISRFESTFAPNALSAFRSAGLENLAEAERVAKDVAPTIVVSSQLKDGSAASVLIAATTNARLLVLGSRGLGGFSGLLVGSVAVAACVHARCAVVVVRGDDGDEDLTRPVVVAVDGTSLSDPAVEFAFDHAAAHGRPLTALHVRDDAGPAGRPGPARDQAEARCRRRISEELAGWRTQHPEVRVLTKVHTGSVAPILIDESKTAALVVVGSRGRGAVSGLFLGSVSHALLQRSHGPLAVVRERTSRSATATDPAAQSGEAG